MKLLLTIVITSLVMIGCKTTAEQQPAAESSSAQVADATPVDGVVATVKYIDLEGGFYGIESDAGESYLPINLDDEYKEDGLRIIFKMRDRSDVMTTKMWGKTVEITEIQKI